MNDNKKFWQRFAFLYRRFMKSSEGMYEEIADKAKPYLNREMNVLDAGCGTAPMLALLTKEYPDKRYVGLDLTPEMIEKAKEKTLPNTELVVGDCENLPFADASFDIVINSQSFHHYPDPQAFFASVCRVLKAGGCLILRDNTGPDWLMWAWNRVILPLANIFGHGDVKAYQLHEVRQMCEDAGLSVEKLEALKGHRLHLVARKKNV